VFESLFRTLFKYERLVFEQGQFVLGATRSMWVAAAIAATPGVPVSAVPENASRITNPENAAATAAGRRQSASAAGAAQKRVAPRRWKRSANRPRNEKKPTAKTASQAARVSKDAYGRKDMGAPGDGPDLRSP
jgi:hypothetical protein